MGRIFRSTHNGVLTAHTKWLPGVRLRHFSTTCAVYIEDCEGWWLSGCHSSVAEYWQHKPGVLGLIPGGFQPFHFPLFSPQIHLISLYSNVRVQSIVSNITRWFDSWPMQHRYKIVPVSEDNDFILVKPMPLRESFQLWRWGQKQNLVVCVSIESNRFRSTCMVNTGKNSTWRPTQLN